MIMMRRASSNLLCRRSARSILHPADTSCVSSSFWSFARLIRFSSTSTAPLHRHGSLLLKSRDTLGIVSAVSDVVLKHGFNMTGADLHVEKGQRKKSSSLQSKHNATREDDTFLCRFSFEADGSSNDKAFTFDDADSTESFNLQSFEQHVMRVVANFHAEATLLHQSGRLVYFNGAKRRHEQQQDAAAWKKVLRVSGPARMAIFASSRDHCLNDLIDKCRGGDLPVQISYVVSNYQRTEESSHVHRALTRLGIPYHYIPCGKDRSREEWEPDIKNIIEMEDSTEISTQTDFIVLARFMQILSPEFLSWYAPRPIINIHHGLLPSFKGSNPYRQAFDAGVKLIGATAHFVTDELDEGPIIEQLTTRVSHRDTVRDVRIKSETLEANALHDAVRYYAENRVARVGGRTIVFT